MKHTNIADYLDDEQTRNRCINIAYRFERRYFYPEIIPFDDRCALLRRVMNNLLKPYYQDKLV